MQHRPYMRSFRQIQKDMKKSHEVEGEDEDLKITKGTYEHPTLVGGKLDHDLKIGEGDYNPTYIDFDQAVIKPDQSNNNLSSNKYAAAYGGRTIETLNRGTKPPLPLFTENDAPHDTHSNAKNSSLLGLNKRTYKDGKLVAELPIDVDAQNKDPKIKEYLIDLLRKGDSKSKLISKIMHDFSAPKDTISDKYNISEHGVNLSKRPYNSVNVLDAINRVEGFVPLTDRPRRTAPGSGGHFDPLYAEAYVSPESDDMNGPAGYGHTSRFHEKAFHPIVSAVRSMSDDSIERDDGNIRVFSFDHYAWECLKNASDNKIVTDYGELIDYCHNIERDPSLTRLTVEYLIGEIPMMLNVIHDLSNGMSLKDIEQRGLKGKIPSNSIHHDLKTFTDGVETPGAIRTLVNEMIAAIGEIHATGDLFKPQVQKLVGPFMIGAYVDYLKRCIELIPAHTDKKDYLEIRKMLFKKYNDPLLQKFMREKYGVRKSKTFKELLIEKNKIKWGI